MTSANKFLQKIWNLNFLIHKRKNKDIDKKLEKKFDLVIKSFTAKIDNSIKSFRFNVSIAHFYEIYKVFKDAYESNISNNLLKENIILVMKLMIPFIPHLSYECLELHKSKTKNDWPKIEANLLEEIKLAIQINGKTRDIITIQKNLVEKDIDSIIRKNSKAKKYIQDKKILKTIFVKNKIINYIIPK